jgi:hypothetical protein
MLVEGGLHGAIENVMAMTLRSSRRTSSVTKSNVGVMQFIKVGK